MKVPAALLILATTLSAAPSDGEILIVYDNTSIAAGIQGDWGFAAAVTFAGHRVLFDTGTKPDVLLSNLEKLKVDPGSIEQVLISHAHRDHFGGLFSIWRKNSRMSVHFLDAFPSSLFREAEAAGIRPSRATGPFELTPGILSTGIVEGNPPEQSMVLETSRGIVLLTGCSHPGLVKIVETVERQRNKHSILLVVGGFHMGGQDEATIRRSIARLKEMKVVEVIPTHCTPELASRLFKEAYAERCRPGGAGTRIALD